ncbi:CoA transferase [Sphingobium sp.]|uniref:CaiB/BaiF CoA-transferase family protein n=1 Tax=Sphingobium sp. TaxID=1912891 RepID=UPI0028BD33BF|nr:CoA transferase [Sphingobium sp.]
MTGALEGIRVIDFGQYLAAPAAAMILADHGAEVIRVDPPGGPRWQHHANAILQRGKQSIVLDLKKADDLAVARELIATADVVLESFRPGVMEKLKLGYAAMAHNNPLLIYCSVPGFGRDDPRAHVPAWEGVVAAAAALYTKGGNKLHKAAGADSTDPIFNPLPLASNYAAMVAVNSIIAALIARERSGLGQQIEVPLFDAAFEGFGHFAQVLPEGTANAVIHGAVDNVYLCKDERWIYLSLPVPGLWRRFSEHFMSSSWFEGGFDDPKSLAADPAKAEEAVERMAALFLTRSSGEWEELGKVAGIPFTTCLTTKEWLHDPHAEAAGMAIDLDDPEYGVTRQAGYCVMLDKTPPFARSPRRPPNADAEAIRAGLTHRAPPRVAAATEPGLRKALEGINIVDTSHFLAGPTSTRILSEFGATVLKVDGPARPVIGMLQVNSGKRTALIDLKRDEGRTLLWSYVEKADVFVQNFARNAIDRLGFSETTVRERNPSIIYASESCYGDAGPRGGQHGVEGVGQTRSGMALRWGAGTPKLQRYIVCDYGTGHLFAMSILLALFHRHRTGEGQHAQATLMQSGTYHQLPFAIDYDGRIWDEPAGPNAKGWSSTDRLYEAADGWFYLAAPRDVDQQRLSAIPDITAHFGARPLDADGLTALFATRPLNEWVPLLEAAGVGAHCLVDFYELLASDLPRLRGTVVMRDHPGIGVVRGTGPSARLSHTPVSAASPVGRPGHDTAEVAREAGAAGEAALHARAVADANVPGTLVWL